MGFEGTDGRKRYLMTDLPNLAKEPSSERQKAVRARNAVVSAFAHGDPGEQELAVKQWLKLLLSRGV